MQNNQLSTNSPDEWKYNSNVGKPNQAFSWRRMSLHNRIFCIGMPWNIGIIKTTKIWDYGTLISGSSTTMLETMCSNSDT